MHNKLPSFKRRKVKNMKKRTKVILGFIIGVLFVYSAIVTFAVRETMADLEQKTTDYELMKEDYFELHEKYQKLVFDNAIK
jgi:hypothetical protein